MSQGLNEEIHDDEAHKALDKMGTALHSLETAMDDLRAILERRRKEHPDG